MTPNANAELRHVERALAQNMTEYVGQQRIFDNDDAVDERLESIRQALAATLGIQGDWRERSSDESLFEGEDGEDDEEAEKKRPAGTADVAGGPARRRRVRPSSY